MGVSQKLLKQMQHHYKRVQSLLHVDSIPTYTVLCPNQFLHRKVLYIYVRKCAQLYAFSDYINRGMVRQDSALL